MTRTYLTIKWTYVFIEIESIMSTCSNNYFCLPNTFSRVMYTFKPDITRCVRICTKCDFSGTLSHDTSARKYSSRMRTARLTTGHAALAIRCQCWGWGVLKWTSLKRSSVLAYQMLLAWGPCTVRSYVRGKGRGPCTMRSHVWGRGLTVWWGPMLHGQWSHGTPCEYTDTTENTTFP